jgi:predicted ATPase
MITQVRISHFKRFGIEETFDFSGCVTLLAGPNNSGKSTVLQALAAWNLALQHWLSERGRRAGSRRISLTVDEFTAAPVRELNLLWENRRTAVAHRTSQGKATSEARPIVVTVSGANGEAAEAWQMAVEFMYASPKLIYARPYDPRKGQAARAVIPPAVEELRLVHIPAFSGLETEEPYRDPGNQNRLIGQGRPGEIVRNLLWELWQAPDKSGWSALAEDMRRLFQAELQPPVYGPAQPYIVCEYRPLGRGGRRAPKLDLANAGSGFHQVLMLLAFFYARPATTLLLDEPDAHLHFVLQREVLNHLRTVAAARQSQLIVATHAEALLDQTEPTSIISFYQKPHRLQTRAQAQQLRDALQRLSSTDLLQADHSGAILYVKDEADARLLKEWANVLQHPARRFFRLPYIYTLGRAADPEEARRHFLALRVAAPQIGGLCLLDRDPAGRPAPSAWPAGMRLLRWRCCEIESYLLNAAVIRRYVAQSYQQAPETAHQPSLEQAYVEAELARLGLENVDCRDETAPGLQDVRASDLLLSILSKSYRKTAKRDLYLVARAMRPEEVHPEVIEKLDVLASLLPPQAEGSED